MPHLLFLYLIMVYTAGFAALVIIFAVYFRSRDRLVLSYAVFYLAFTLLVVMTGADLYLKTNVADEPLAGAVERLSVWATLFFSCTIVMLMGRFFPRRRMRLAEWLFYAAALGLLLLNAFPAGRSIAPAHALLAAASLYSLIVCAVALKKTEARDRGFTLIMVIGLGVFTPLIFIPTFFQGVFSSRLGGVPPQLITFPLFYCYHGILFARHFLRNYPAPDAGDPAPLHPEEYGLSEREREVAMLVASGESNRSIGEKLFISVPTVKKHLHNIFGKMGIRTRYQLIHTVRKGR